VSKATAGFLERSFEVYLVAEAMSATTSWSMSMFLERSFEVYLIAEAMSGAMSWSMSMLVEPATPSYIAFLETTENQLLGPVEGSIVESAVLQLYPMMILRR
jgi:hypothetical protein